MEDLLPEETPEEAAALEKEIEEAGDAPYKPRSQEPTWNSENEGALVEGETPEAGKTDPLEEPPAKKGPLSQDNTEEVDAEHQTTEAQKRHSKGLEHALAAQRRETQRVAREAQERLAATISSFDEKLEAIRNPPPDPDMDPEGYREHQTQQLAKKVETLEKRTTEQAAMDQIAQAQEAVFEQARADRDTFAVSTPDFDPAYQHVYNSRFQMLAADNPGATEDQLVQGMRNIEAQFYQAAINRGESPAEAVYNLAKNTGYKQSNGNGAKPVAANDNLNRIAKGQAASKSVSGGESAKVTGKILTPEELAAIRDPEEFEKEYQRRVDHLTGSTSFS